MWHPCNIDPFVPLFCRHHGGHGCCVYGPTPSKFSAITKSSLNFLLFCDSGSIYLFNNRKMIIDSKLVDDACHNYVVCHISAPHLRWPFPIISLFVFSPVSD
jgi:hypothetical protein